MNHEGILEKDVYGHFYGVCRCGWDSDSYREQQDAVDAIGEHIDYAKENGL